VISLPRGLGGEISKEGESSYPFECCGLVLGEDLPGGRVARAIVPTNNLREGEDRRRRFVIAPEDFLRAEREALAAGLSVVGVYHSHPDHPARPSEYDLGNALPFFSYLIVGVSKGRSGDLTSWLLRGDRSGFDPEGLELT
jgi:proteasome lid subunit RPN8/RPN11